MKKIIAYGAGAAFRNYIKNNKNEFLFVIDNNLNIDHIEDIKVRKFKDVKEFLLENKEEIFIIIFAMSSKVTRSISEELMSLGFIYGEHFNEYSFLLKDELQHKFKKHNVNLSKSTYEFTKNLFKAVDIENQSSVLGTWIFLSLIEETKNLEGDIAELGVYKGGNAYYSCLYKTSINDSRKYYLVDSFEGFKEFSEFDPISLKNMFKDNSYKYVKGLFQDFESAEVLKGFIPDILSECSHTKKSIVYYDCDTYESCKDSLNELYPKLQQNGYFIIHDYEAKEEGFTGVKKAVNEYLDKLKENEVEIINIPETTHIILKKL